VPVHLGGGVAGGPPLEGGVPRKSSKFTPDGGGTGTAARVVVNPMRRPMKMIAIHMRMDVAPTALPTGGADGALSQR